jgi:hypothetical protein
MGYSQGAHVVGDVLGGGQGGNLGTATPAIAANISSHVVAVATFGDPRHVASGRTSTPAPRPVTAGSRARPPR